jgi:hypothetical protein
VAAATADDRKPATADNPAKSETPGVTPAAVDEESTAEPMSTDGVSELLGRLDAGERPPPPEPTAPPPDVEPAAMPAADGVVAAATGSAAPADSLPVASTASAAIEVDTTVTVPPGDSWLSRTLVAVLDPFGDEARDLIGKIAIITAVNAVAVLLYVWLFRK